MQSNLHGCGFEPTSDHIGHKLTKNTPKKSLNLNKLFLKGKNVLKLEAEAAKRSEKLLA